MRCIDLATGAQTWARVALEITEIKDAEAANALTLRFPDLGLITVPNLLYASTPAFPL
jgi:hypothetical protein